MSAYGAGPGGLIRQGDVLLIPVREIPTDGEVESKRVADRFVLAEGEATGHAHVAVGSKLRRVEWRRSRRWDRPERRTYLVVDAKEGATLNHEEHLPLAVECGVYEVRRQREYRSGGCLRVSD